METINKVVETHEMEMYMEMAKRNLAPNLVSIKPISKKKGFYKIVMERYPDTLISYNKKHGKVSKNILRAVDDLIDRLHNENIIHGDLHGDNIIIDMRNIPYRIKLIDFSTSQFTEDIDDDWFSIFNAYNGPEPYCENIKDAIRIEKTQYLRDVNKT